MLSTLSTIHDSTLNNWSVPRNDWKDETVFILGCGPSLNDYNDLSLLTQYGRVIAVNDSYLVCPWADILYFTDGSWFTENHLKIRKVFCGRRIVTIAPGVGGVCRLNNSGPTGFDPHPSSLRHGSSSSYAAMHLAIHFGVKRIILLGMDFKSRGHKVHWRSRPGRQQNAAAQNKTMQLAMLPKFEGLVEVLKERNIEVFNSSYGSLLTLWPYKDFKSLLPILSAERKELNGQCLKSLSLLETS